MSYSRKLKQDRLTKLNSQWNNFIVKSLSTKELKKNYGVKGAKVAFAFINIQRNSVRFNKKISAPSLEVVAEFSGCTKRHAQYVINDLIKNGILHFENYFLLNEDGTIATVNNIKSTNGRLRKIINPLKGVADYISKTSSERKEAGKLYANKMFTKYIYAWLNRQPYSDQQSTIISPVDSMKDPTDSEWLLDL